MNSNRKFVIILEILVITFFVMCVVPVCGLSDSSADISATPSIVNPGDEITVTFSGAPGFELDFIVMCEVGDLDEGVYYGWQYLEGKKSGTLIFTAPYEPGDYVFQLFESVEFTDIARSNIVTVQEGTTVSTPTPTIGDTDISATPSIVNPGDEITVTFSGAPGFELDWIAMYKVGDPNDEEYDRGYYLAGKKSGTLIFTAPDEPGDYEFRLFEDDGYTDIARSNIVTVQEGTTVSTPTPTPTPTPTTPSERGLVRYWNFNEGSGTIAYDSSGSGNDGTIHGATWVDNGSCEKALSFDGVDDYVETNPATFQSKDITVEAWIYPKSFSGYKTILHKGDRIGANNLLFAFDLISNKISFYISSNGNNWDSTVGTTILELNKWYHVVGVYRSSDKFFAVYVNGTEDNTKTSTLSSLYHDASKYWIGARYDNRQFRSDRYFNGIIDEVKIYNYALSADEIKTLYEGKEPSAPTTTPPTTPTQGELLSQAQQEIVDAFGQPSEFGLTYLFDSETEYNYLVRTEIWFYPEHQKKITFVAGEIYSVDDIPPVGEEVTYSDLKPEDFDCFMNYEQVVDRIGGNIEPLDFVPESFSEYGVESYLGDKVIFVIADDQLAYLQTLGVVEDLDVGEKLGLEKQLAIQSHVSALGLIPIPRFLKKAARFLYELPGKITKKLLGRGKGAQIVAKIVEFKLGKVKLWRVATTVNNIAALEDGLKEARGVYWQQKNKIDEEVVRLKEAKKELDEEPPLPSERDMSYTEWKKWREEKGKSLDDIIAVLEEMSKKLDGDARKLSIRYIKKIAAKDVVGKVMGNIRDIFLREISDEFAKLAGGNVIKTFLETGGMSAETVIDLIINGDISRALGGSGDDRGDLKDRIREAIKKQLKEDRDYVLSNWRKILDETIAKILKEGEEGEEAIEEEPTPPSGCGRWCGQPCCEGKRPCRPSFSGLERECVDGICWVTEETCRAYCLKSLGPDFISRILGDGCSCICTRKDLAILP